MTTEPEQVIKSLIDNAEEVPASTDSGAMPGPAKGKPTQADTLIKMAKAAELFHTPDGLGFADICIGNHRQTYALKSSGFNHWLRHRYYEATGSAPSENAMADAMRTLEANAQFASPERVVHMRIAEFDNRVYLDLADEAGRVVEIDRRGWRIVDDPPVRFRRPPGMRSLPLPQRDGSIDRLREFVNVQSDHEFVLAVSWLLASLRASSAYPVLVISGEQGTAKSTLSGVLRSLVDPNAVPLRALPREARDLHIAANNGHVLAFDNVSHLSSWLSDTFCQLATGGGFTTRALYTDDEEKMFNASRPILLNGIVDVVERPDLADRSIFLKLPPISAANRRPKDELDAAFAAASPEILGALLDGVVEGLRQLPEVRMDGLPRMAEFAKWATACETAFWPAGKFMSAYDHNRRGAVEQILDIDLVGDAVRTLIWRESEWHGTASELLTALGEIVGERTTKSRAWPSTTQALSTRLQRATTFLRSGGIEIAQAREGKNRTRMIHISERTEASTRIAANDDVLPADDHSPASLNVDEPKVSDQIGAITADEADDDLRTGPDATFDIAKMAERL
ncbi:MAG: hypothetical protein WCG92_14365 [Hyphomicrobiales bacterium]